MGTKIISSHDDRGIDSDQKPIQRIGWTKKLAGNLFAFIGPGYLVAVGYMDPGNWATDLWGGSRYGYKFRTYESTDEKWFGLNVRSLKLPQDLDAKLVPLFGHTPGHCGVAYLENGKWSLHADDVYFDSRTNFFNKSSKRGQARLGNPT